MSDQCISCRASVECSKCGHCDYCDNMKLRQTEECVTRLQETLDVSRNAAAHAFSEVAKFEAENKHLRDAIQNAIEYGEVSFLGVNIPFEAFKNLKKALGG